VYNIVCDDKFRFNRDHNTTTRIFRLNTAGTVDVYGSGNVFYTILILCPSVLYKRNLTKTFFNKKISGDIVS